METTFSKSRWALAVLCLLVFASCRPDPQDDLDSLLDDALRTASNGQGRSHFRMPTDGDLASIPQDPSNPLTDEKVELGKFLFHETALGTNPRVVNGEGTYSCASCHHARGGFQANLLQGIGEGGMGYGSFGEGRVPDPSYPIDSIDVQPIRTPSALNVAYQTITLWNGQFGAHGDNVGTESHWTTGTPKEDNYLGFEGPEIQAIAGLKVHRMDVSQLLTNAPGYDLLFQQAFPNVPVQERISRKNAGLAIAAYERTLLASQSPFQRWLRGDVNALNDQEKNGAILFFGKAQCYKCHNGPALDGDMFKAIGMGNLSGAGTYGVDPNHDAHLGRGGFTGNSEDMYCFKVPQLYNLDNSPFYGHGGTFTTLESVIRYKNAAVPQNPDIPQSQLADEFVPLNLSDLEISDIATFIRTGLRDDNLQRFEPYSLPSGNCFPNADPASRADLGCN